MYINIVVFKNGESARIRSEEPLVVGKENRLLTMYDVDRNKFISFETNHIKAISSVNKSH